MKIAKILILFACVAAMSACKDDSGDNPEFGKYEVYIYDNKGTSLSATQGVPASWDMLVSPNDGSVACRWIVDGVTISTEKVLVYTFEEAGSFTLRFEATRNGFTNYRQFVLNVALAPVP